jgi:hypothetical protein
MVGSRAGSRAGSIFFDLKFFSCLGELYKKYGFSSISEFKDFSGFFQVKRDAPMEKGCNYGKGMEKGCNYGKGMQLWKRDATAIF